MNRKDLVDALAESLVSKGILRVRCIGDDESIFFVWGTPDRGEQIIRRMAMICEVLVSERTEGHVFAVCEPSVVLLLHGGMDIVDGKAVNLPNKWEGPTPLSRLLLAYNHPQVSFDSEAYIPPDLKEDLEKVHREIMQQLAQLPYAKRFFRPGHFIVPHVVSDPVFV